MCGSQPPSPLHLKRSSRTRHRDSRLLRALGVRRGRRAEVDRHGVSCCETGSSMSSTVLLQTRLALLGRGVSQRSPERLRRGASLSPVPLIRSLLVAEPEESIQGTLELVRPREVPPSERDPPALAEDVRCSRSTKGFVHACRGFVREWMIPRSGHVWSNPPLNSLPRSVSTRRSSHPARANSGTTPSIMNWAASLALRAGSVGGSVACAQWGAPRSWLHGPPQPAAAPHVVPARPVGAPAAPCSGRRGSPCRGDPHFCDPLLPPPPVNAAVKLNACVRSVVTV